MIWAIPWLVAAGIAGGPALAKIRRTWLRRLLGWGALSAFVAGAHLALVDADPILRMIGICCVLLGAMKGLVYAEWAGPGSQALTPARYGTFALLWFGMDPASFRKRREGLDGKRDVHLGLLLTGVGTLGAWLVWRMEWRQIFLMFLPMSLGFHFGALRVLKGGLRAAGFPVRTLFPNPLEARGIGDFWSKRWNVGYSQMMQRLVGRPVAARAGEPAGVMAVFVGSGVLHELAITLPVQSGFGLPTLYFTVHGMLTLIEKRRGRVFGRLPALLAVILPMGLLFPPVFQREVMARCLNLFEIAADWLLPRR